jgi:hypothetical protein
MVVTGLTVDATVDAYLRAGGLYLGDPTAWV